MAILAQVIVACDAARIERPLQSVHSNDSDVQGAHARYAVA